MRNSLFALLGLFTLTAAFAPAAGAADDIANRKALKLLAKLRVKKPEPAPKLPKLKKNKNRNPSAATPILNFALTPNPPVQGSALTAYIRSVNNFGNRELSLDTKLNGQPLTAVVSPTKGFFVASLGVQAAVQSFVLEATLFLENPKDNAEVRDAIKALDIDIKRLTNQINAERDPVKRRTLELQREEKVALKTELLTQLKRLRARVGTQAYSFSVGQDPGGEPGTGPVVSELSPVSGSASGGTQVTFLGRDFTQNVQVKFGGIAASNVAYVSQNRITAVTPSFDGAPGSKDVELTFTSGGRVTDTVLLRGAYFAIDTSGQPAKPVAVAAGSRKISLGETAQLDGSESYATRSTNLAYRWTIVAAPSNSNYAVGQDLAAVVNPLLSPSVFGTYVVQLQVTEADTPEHLQSEPSIAVVQVDGGPQPVANPIAVRTGGTATTQVFANDSTQGDSFTYAILVPPLHGTASVSDSGIVTFIAANDYEGEDSLVVQVTDQDGHTGTVQIPVVVGVTNRPPNPTADPIVTHTEGKSTQVNPNDPDSGQSHTYAIESQPHNGTAFVDQAGLVQFSSNAGFTGNDNLVVRVTDNGDPSFSGIAVVQVTVHPNAIPQVSAQPIFVGQGGQATSQASVVNEAGQGGAYGVTPPAHGTATINTEGLVQYAPAAGYAGNDSFLVTYTDAGNPALMGSVSVPVVVNGPPVVSAPDILVPEGETVATSQVEAIDPNEGQTLTYVVSSTPAHGTATVSSSGLVTYTAEQGYQGPDTLVVTVFDDGTPQASGSVTIAVQVGPVNHPPSGTAAPISVFLGEAATTQVEATDPDQGQLLSYSIPTQPQHGTASVSASGLVTYISTGSAAGTDSVVVRVTDNGSPVLSADIPIQVFIFDNQPPTGSAPAISVGQGGVGTSQITASDPDQGQSVSFAIAQQPVSAGTASVSASGLVTLNASTFLGSDSVVVRISDNGTPARHLDLSIPITITSNLPPVIPNGAAPNAIGYTIRSQGVPYSVGLGLGFGNTENITDPDGTITSVVWNFGDGTSERVDDIERANILHNYVAAGTYQATVTATDNHGATTTQPVTIEVVDTDIPTAKFTASPSNGGGGTVPITITFDASASADADGITQYRWRFGGNATSEVVTTDPVITRTFNSAPPGGSVAVRLRTRDANRAQGESTVPVPVGTTANGSPMQAQFLVGPPRQVLVNTPMSFNGSRSFNPNVGGSITGYQWNFNDFISCPGPTGGCTATGLTASHTYPFAGNAFPSLRVQNPSGALSGPVSQEVFVVNTGHAPHAVPRFSATSGVAPLTITVDGTDSYDYDGTLLNAAWFDGVNQNGNSGFTHTFTYTVPDAYVTRFFVNDNDGNQHSVTQTITVTSAAQPAKKRTVPYEPEREYQRQVLAGACYDGSAEACSGLADMYLEDGDTFTASKLKERACTMGYQPACSR